MYRFYTYDISNLTDDQFNQWYERLDPVKKIRVDRFKFLDDKKRTVVGDALARKAIFDLCGENESDVTFFYTDKGKPFIKKEKVYFNLSHSNNLVVCVASDRNIGVDVEKIKEVSPQMVNRVCTESELFSVIDNEGNIDVKSFFKIWTIKEAYFKLVGTGIVDFKKIDSQKINNVIFTEDYDGYILSIVLEDN